MQPESTSECTRTPDRVALLSAAALTTLSDLVAIGRSTAVRALEVDAGGVRLRVEFTAGEQAPDPVRTTAAAAQVAPAEAQEPVAPAPALDRDTPRTRSICAPLVGVLYQRPNPGAPAFCEVGDHVEQGQQVAIIEAMKMMNEVVAPSSGTVVDIVATEHDVVEFGEVLLVLGEG